MGGDKSNRSDYTVSETGAIHKVDSRLDGFDRVVTQIGASDLPLGILTSIKTRQYIMGSVGRKRWNELEMHVQSSDTNTSDFDIDLELENLDSTETIGTLSGFNGTALAIAEDVSIRARLGNKRAYGAQIKLSNTIGRPRVRAIKVSASEAFRSTTKAE